MTFAPSLIAVLNTFNHSVLLVGMDQQGFSLDWAACEPVELLFSVESFPQSTHNLDSYTTFPTCNTPPP